MSNSDSLEVQESPVQFGGRARVNKNTLDSKNLQEGASIVISSESKDILVNIYSDNLIKDGMIKLRGEDRKKLNVKEGDKVYIKEHQTLLNRLL